MGKLKQILEVVTSIGVIVAVAMLGVVLYHTYSGGGEIAPKRGDQLPAVGSYAWSSSPHTLVLAVRKGCHYCEESMPFYRKLAELKKEQRLDASVLVVFPDSAETAQEVLRAQNVDLPSTAGINLSTLKVGGTPTLILADREGKVEKSWVGKQGESGERSILQAVGL